MAPGRLPGPLLLLLLLGVAAPWAAAKQCPAPSKCSASDSGARPSSCYPAKPGYFEDLSPTEVKIVLDYLKPKAAGLKFTNLTRLTRFGYGVAGVIKVDRYLAPKAEVLAFLDEDGPEPDRAAIVHVTVTNKAGQLVRVAYVLGPLPNITYMKQVPVIQGRMELDVSFARDFEDAAANTNGTESKLVWEWLSGPLKPIVTSLFPNATFGEKCPTTNCLYPKQLYFPQSMDPGSGPLRVFDQWAMGWNTTDAKGNFEATWFSSVYFLQFTFEYFKGAPFKLVDVWFLGESFKSVEGLAEFWETGVPPTDDPKVAARMKIHLAKWKTLSFAVPSSKDDTLYTTFRERPGPKRNPAQPIGPLSFEPYGHRFNITRKHIEWQGWSLEAGVGKYGPRYFDIRFKRERVAYEISVQEAIAAYAGPDPSAARTLYHDSATFVMGWLSLPLIHGVDCPVNSAYLDLDVHQHIGGSNASRSRRNMCVFEHDASLPLVTHTPWDPSTGGAVRSTELYIRVKTTVGNYDYYHQLVLSLDGAIRGEVILSGFLHGVNHIKDFIWDRYSGGPVSPLSGGILHDHTMVWKVDADIGGTKNYLAAVEVKSQRVTTFAGLPWTNKYIKTTKIAKETGLRWNPNRPTTIHIRSSTQTNKWGKPRGYSIHPLRLHSDVFPADAPELKSRQWVKYHAAFTKHSDQEYTCTMEPDPLHPTRPLLEFDSFLNKESIDGEDLVAWITSGVYHVPHAEDAPVTPTTSAPHPGFAMIPFNYHDECGAMDMPDLWYAAQDDTLGLPENAPIIQKYLKAGVCTPSYENQDIIAFKNTYNEFI